MSDDEPKQDEAADEERTSPTPAEAPLDRRAWWRERRLEIAEEPGNHGSFALWCSVAVVVLAAAFFLVRVVLMR